MKRVIHQWGFAHYLALPGDEIVPISVNDPMPTLEPGVAPGPVNMAEPLNVPPPVAPSKRPVPPVIV